MEGLGHTGCGAHIQARLDGQHHAGAQDAAGPVQDGFARQRVAPFAGLAGFARLHIAAAIVHVHAQPVAGAVHVKRKIRPAGDHVLRAAVL